MIKTILILELLLALLFISNQSFAAASNANIVSIVASTTNITTSAYVTLSASTPVGTQRLVVGNTTAQAIIIAVGASGSEQGVFAIGAGLSAVIPLSYYIATGSRLSLEAVGATANTGTVAVSLLP